MYKHFFKRAIDLFLSLIGLIVLSPVFFIIAIAIIIDDPGPVLFKQKRIGIHKSYFMLYKFRSMKMSTPKCILTYIPKNSKQHITKVGKFLRKTRLDELPQIFNIIVGQMSIIGPRPAYCNQDDLVAERDRYEANDIRPGLIGWAQIKDKDGLDISIKTRLDGEYVDKLSFDFDLKCFAETIMFVLKRNAVVEGGKGKENENTYIDKTIEKEKEAVER